MEKDKEFFMIALFMVFHIKIHMKIIPIKIVNFTWNEEEIVNWFNDNFSFYF